MALPYKPHTASVYAGVEVLDLSVEELVKETTHPSITATVKGLKTAKTPARIWEQYAVETKHPALFLFEMADAANITQGARLVISGVVWKVMTSTSKHTALVPHCSTVLEKIYGE